MPLLSIVIVVIRLFGLIWILEGSIQILQSAYSGPMLLKAIVGAIIFKMAQPIARVATSASDAELSPLSISPHLLYTFAFTFLGLWFALSSVGEAFNSMPFLFANAVTPVNPLLPDSYLVKRSSASVVTFIVGIGCLLCAPRLARRFEILQKRYDGKAKLPTEDLAG